MIACCFLNSARSHILTWTLSSFYILYLCWTLMFCGKWGVRRVDLNSTVSSNSLSSFYNLRWFDSSTLSIRNWLQSSEGSSIIDTLWSCSKRRIFSKTWCYFSSIKTLSTNIWALWNYYPIELRLAKCGYELISFFLCLYEWVCVYLKHCLKVFEVPNQPTWRRHPWLFLCVVWAHGS